MELEEARHLVSQHGWLSHTPEPFRHAVLARAVLQSFQAGAVIYSAGDVTGGVYGLVSGRVSIWLDKGERAPSFVHFFRPGTWFGEGPVISGRPRLVGVGATGATQLLYLSLRSVEDILRDDPPAWRLIAGLVLSKLDLAIGAIDDLMIRDKDKRLVAVLLRLGGCRTPGTDVTPVNVDASQEDLATMANVARTTVNGSLRRLAQAGLIRLTYRRVVILEPNKLRMRLVE